MEKPNPPRCLSAGPRRLELSGRAPRAVALALLALGIAAALGCEPSPMAQRRTQMRLNNLHETGTMLAQSEQRRPANLREDMDWVKREQQHRDRDLKDSAAWFGQLFQRDVEHFKAQQPEYRREIERIFRGKPETIEDTAIILFY